MPDADGFEVAGWIRMFSDRVIIAFITAMISYSLKGYNYNAIRYIPKILISWNNQYMNVWMRYYTG